MYNYLPPTPVTTLKKKIKKKNQLMTIHSAFQHMYNIHQQKCFVCLLPKRVYLNGDISL